MTMSKILKLCLDMLAFSQLLLLVIIRLILSLYVNRRNILKTLNFLVYFLMIILILFSRNIIEIMMVLMFFHRFWWASKLNLRQQSSIQSIILLRMEIIPILSSQTIGLMLNIANCTLPHPIPWCYYWYSCYQFHWKVTNTLLRTIPNFLFLIPSQLLQSFLHAPKNTEKMTILKEDEQHIDFWCGLELEAPVYCDFWVIKLTFDTFIVVVVVVVVGNDMDLWNL